MEQTLEHIISLDSTMKVLGEFLRPNGLLYIGVPDANRFKYVDDYYQQFSTEHINYFTDMSLQNLLAGYGYEMVTIDHSTVTWCLHSIFKKSEKIFLPTVHDEKGKNDIKEYLDKSKDIEKRLKDKVDNITDLGRINIYCAGTQTAMLFQSKVLKEKSIASIIDSNKNYQGSVIYGREIIGIDDLDNELPILVISPGAQSVIRWIKENYKIRNKLIPLYD